MNLTFPHYIESLLAASWLPQVMTVLAVVVGLNIVASIVLRYVEKLTARTSTVWDEALVRAARSPVTLVLWTVGTAYAIQIVDAHLGLTVPDMVGQVMRSLIIVALAWFLLRLIGQVSRGVLARSEAEGQGIDRTTVDALSKLGRVTVLVVALLVVLQHLGFSVSGVLAFGGIGGIAVGFAAKDMLANFFGGLTIYLDRPFTVGEWIRSPDKQIEGTVEYIGWRHTRVRAFNKNPIYVPNALFTSIVVENPTRMTNRRIKETIGVRYDDIGKSGAHRGGCKSHAVRASGDRHERDDHRQFQPVWPVVARHHDLHLHQDEGMGAFPRDQAGRAVADRRHHRVARGTDRVPDADPLCRVDAGRGRGRIVRRAGVSGCRVRISAGCAS